MASYVAKIQYKDSLRRLTLGGKGNELVFSYAQLESRTRDLFQLPPTTQVVLTYIDKDGDAVTLSGDQDLKDALVLQSLNPLRLNVAITNGTTNDPANDVKVDSPIAGEKPRSGPEDLQKAAESEVAQPTGKDNGVNESSVAAARTDDRAPAGASDGAEKVEQILHHGVVCDGCGTTPLAGPRFKSCKKPDYDLCVRCFKANGVDPNDYFKIDRRLNPRLGHPFVGRMMGLSPALASRKSCTPPAPAANSAPPKSDSTPTDANGKDAATAEKPDVNPKRIVHNGVMCDGCGMSPISGPRFKSSKKSNYDLCLGCFQKSGKSTSEYSRVDRPVNSNTHPLVLLRMARLASPYGPMCGRRVWVPNQMVPKQTVDQSHADEETKAPSGGTDVLGDSVEPAAQNGPSSSVAAKGPTGATTEDAKAPVPEGDLSTRDSLLAKLGAMGFTDQKLNGELLEKNNLDLRATLDDLCAADDWDLILEELQEMGFSDADMNRRLLFKNNGSVKLVVKELVQLAKEPASGKGEKKA